MQYSGYLNTLFGFIFKFNSLKMPKVTEFSYLKCHMWKSPFNAIKFPSFFLDPQNLSVFFRDIPEILNARRFKFYIFWKHCLQVLDRFRQGLEKIIIATDVLCRGIDVEQVHLLLFWTVLWARKKNECITSLHYFLFLPQCDVSDSHIFPHLIIFLCWDWK